MMKVILVVWPLIGLIAYTKFKVETKAKFILDQDVIGAILSMITYPVILVHRFFINI